MPKAANSALGLSGNLRAIGAGTGLGLHLGIRIIAIAALIFGGSLSAASISGTTIFLCATIAATAFTLMMRNTPILSFTIAQDTPVAVLMPILLSVAAGRAGVPPRHQGRTGFPRYRVDEYSR